MTDSIRYSNPGNQLLKFSQKYKESYHGYFLGNVAILVSVGQNNSYSHQNEHHQLEMHQRDEYVFVVDFHRVMQRGFQLRHFFPEAQQPDGIIVL
jgi:hypothetical protein